MTSCNARPTLTDARAAALAVLAQLGLPVLPREVVRAVAAYEGVMALRVAGPPEPGAAPRLAVAEATEEMFDAAARNGRRHRRELGACPPRHADSVDLGASIGPPAG